MYRADLSVYVSKKPLVSYKAKAILQPISLYFKKFLKAKAIWLPISIYFNGGKKRGKKKKKKKTKAVCGLFSLSLTCVLALHVLVPIGIRK